MTQAKKKRIAARNAPILKQIKKQERRTAFNQAAVRRQNKSRE
jgi:hypothetical protein